MAISRNKATTTADTTKPASENKYDDQVDTKPAQEATVALAPSDRNKAEKVEKPKQPKTGTATTRTTKKVGKAVASEQVETEQVQVTEEVKPDPAAEVKATPAKKEKAKKEVEPKVEEPAIVNATLPCHLDPNGFATVAVTGSRTLNLGNFESAKIEVHLAVQTALADIDSTHAFAVGWVEGKLEASIPAKPAAVTHGAQPQRTIIHGSDEPVTPSTPRPASTAASTARPPATTNRPPASTPAPTTAKEVFEEVADEIEQEVEQPATQTTRPATTRPPASARPAETQVGDTGTRVIQEGEAVDPAFDPNYEWPEDL